MTVEFADVPKELVAYLESLRNEIATLRAEKAELEEKVKAAATPAPKSVRDMNRAEYRRHKEQYLRDARLSYARMKEERAREATLKRYGGNK